MVVVCNFGLFLLKCVLTIITYAHGRWRASEAWSPLSQDLLHWPPLRSSHWRRQRAIAAIPLAMTSVRDFLVAFHYIGTNRTEKLLLSSIILWTAVVSKPIKYHFICCFHSGPFGERDDQQVFIQKVIPVTNKLFVRLSSTGKRYILRCIQFLNEMHTASFAKEISHYLVLP